MSNPFPVKIASFLIERTPTIQSLPLLVGPLARPIYYIVNHLGSITGLDAELLLFMLCLWSSFGLMLLMRIVPSGTIRMTLTTLFGMTIAFLLFGVGAFHSLVCIAFGYIMLILTSWLQYYGLSSTSSSDRRSDPQPKRENIFRKVEKNVSNIQSDKASDKIATIPDQEEKRKVRHLFQISSLKLIGKISAFVYIVMFVHLFLVHWYRMSIDYLGWHLDFSLIQMLLVLKIISVQYNYYDGIRVTLLKRNGIDPILHMYPQHVGFSITSIPSPLEYLSFMYFFPIILSGPTVEFTDFMTWVYSTSLPWAPMEAAKNAMWGFFCMMIYVGIGPLFPMEKVLMRPFIDNVPFHKLIFRQFVGAFCLRSKYFVSWYFGQANCVIGGFGAHTNPKTKQLEWSGIDQAKFMQVEFATSIRDYANNWNANVSRWLRLYCYARVTDITYGKSGGVLNMICTMVTSAIWHGLYPGYYLLWIVLASISEIHKTFFRKVTRNILSAEEISGKKWTLRVIVWNVISWALTQIMASQLVSSFQLLSLGDSIAYFNQVYWFVHVAAIVSGVIVFSMPPIRISKKKRE